MPPDLRRAGWALKCAERQKPKPMEMRIAVCQTDMEWMNPERNLERLEPLVAGAGADLVLLPEMFALSLIHI